MKKDGVNKRRLGVFVQHKCDQSFKNVIIV